MAALSDSPSFFRPARGAKPATNQVWRNYYLTDGRRIAMRMQDGTTVGKMIGALTTDYVKISDLSAKLNGLPGQ